MAVLFVSHASRDDAAIRDLEAWLDAKGFTDRFVDHSDIRTGEKWLAELRKSVAVCRVALCFVTESWLASDPCIEEFGTTTLLGKRIMPLFALASDATAQPARLIRVRAEAQGLDVSKWLKSDGRLDPSLDAQAEAKLERDLRAAGALFNVGLDPEAFAINKELRETPFPGLASFGDEEADAAIFYGRSREIAESLEELREMRARGDSRPYVILGASGSGKSSLLKAGILPRLRREAPLWLPLRAFRPGNDPLRNFADALARTLDHYGKPEALGVLRDALLGAWQGVKPLTDADPAAPLRTALEAIGDRLIAAADRPDATILVSIDQAEELARANGPSGDALAAYLRAVTTAKSSRWRVALTIRDDSWPEFRKHARFEAWEARVKDLPTVGGHYFDDLVKKPAGRYGVLVAPDLVDALMHEASGQDALPLLAYGLERLWREFHATGELTLAQYVGFEGLGGLIQRGAESALAGLSPEDAAPALTPSQSRLDLAAATFVPALVDVNEKREAVRRIADWRDFTPEQQALLKDFVSWRLVVLRNDPPKVEVAHEALFRKWGRLEGWLEPERARLDALRALKAAATTWNSNRRQPAYLMHRGKRLVEAEALPKIAEYARRLVDADFAYLAGCRAAERRSQATVAALAIALILGLLGWMNNALVVQEYDRVVYGWPYWWKHFRGHELTAEAARAKKKGDHFRECDANCPEMIVVPSGNFAMGSPDVSGGTGREEDGIDMGRPPHPVVIAYAFAVGIDDITFDEWDACVAAGGCATNALDYNSGRGTKPAVGVSWDDANQYVTWLNSMTGGTYRLLSEAEWEYVARAGATTAYYWGEEFRKGQANCNGCGSQWDNKQSSPVGSFAANAFGLHDMAGNVWQWVEDCYHPNFDDSTPRNGSPWLEKECANRNVRGASWSNLPPYLRSAVRYGSPPGNRINNLGFRVARTLDP